MNPTTLRHALQRTPPHLVLHLQPGRADLHLDRGDGLAPLTTEGFPLAQTGRAPASPPSGEDLAGFLARVDEAFGRVRAAHPSPMVLAGPLDLVTAFADQSHNLYRLAGVVTGRAAESAAALSAAAREAVEPYLLSREAEALWTLQHALTSRPGLVARGPEACRDQLRRGRPEMLVAEEGVAAAGSDMVAELVEAVIDQGGWVALAHEGALQPHGGIALVLERSAAAGPAVEDQGDGLSDGGS